MAAVFWMASNQNTAAIAFIGTELGNITNQLSIVEHDVALDPVPAVQRHALVQQLNNHIDSALEACKVESHLTSRTTDAGRNDVPARQSGLTVSCTISARLDVSVQHNMSYIQALLVAPVTEAMRTSGGMFC